MVIESPQVPSPRGQLIHRRVDMEQADIAPLMSALIGVPYPLNSVGRLPLDYLQASVEDRAAMLVANAEQVFDLMRMNHGMSPSSLPPNLPHSNVTTTSHIIALHSIIFIIPLLNVITIITSSL